MADEEMVFDSKRVWRLVVLAVVTALLVQIHPALILVTLWYILLKALEDRGVLDKWNASRILGIILMLRTNRGKKVLESISKPRAAWRVFGDVGLWTCRIASVIVLVFFVLSFIVAMLRPSELEATPPSELVLIPGVSPTIPLGWGLVSLIIALVVHEYGHGILARAHGMRVRNFGLLMVGPVPIGAFAEPEARELLRAPRIERQRVFAAGPAVNIFGSFICFMILAAIANQMVAPSGAYASGIIDEQPAQQGGLEAWEIITHFDSEPITGYTDMRDQLDSHDAGDQVTLTVLSLPDESGIRTTRTMNVTLADHYLYEMDRGTDPEILEALGIERGDAFLGVAGLSSTTSGADRLAGPLDTDYPDSALAKAIGFGIQPLSIIFAPVENRGEIMHPNELAMLNSDDSILGTQNMLYLLHFFFWLTWMNALLGFANLIPLVPFDGGHLLRDRLHDYLTKLSAMSLNWHPMRVERMANTISMRSSFVVLVMFVLLLITPYIM